jgi:hypothetical protein
MDNSSNFKTMFCNGQIKELSKYDIIVKGRIEEQVENNKIFYIAASPADHRANYSGSGLPFYNQLQAFDNTPNIGTLDVGYDNSFEIKLLTPNSYMVGLGSVTIPPTLYIEFVDLNGNKKDISIKVSNGIPYRTLTYPLTPRPRENATFYDSQFYLPVRSQEQILLDSGYPKTNNMPSNFWGLKPPL